MRKKPAEDVTNAIKSVYWLNSRLDKTEEKISELEHSAEINSEHSMGS